MALFWPKLAKSKQNPGFVSREGACVALAVLSPDPALPKRTQEQWPRPYTHHQQPHLGFKVGHEHRNPCWRDTWPVNRRRSAGKHVAIEPQQRPDATGNPPGNIQSVHNAVL